MSASDKFEVNLVGSRNRASVYLVNLEARKGGENTAFATFTSNFVSSFNSHAVFSLVQGLTSSTRCDFDLDINTFVSGCIGADRASSLCDVGAKLVSVVTAVTTITSLLTRFGLVARR